MLLLLRLTCGLTSPGSHLANMGRYTVEQARIRRKMAPTKPLKRRRARPGSAAVRQIKSLQSSTNLLIPKKPFGRCVREIAQEMKYDVPFTKEAMEAIQVAAEAFLTDMFKSCIVYATHAKRATIKPEDMKLAAAKGSGLH